MSAPVADQSPTTVQEVNADGTLTIVVIGASGDLARKKTFPALFSLQRHGLLPDKCIIAGYSRSPMDEEKFHTRISSCFPKGTEAEAKRFLARCFYHPGAYAREGFESLNSALDEKEAQLDGEEKHNRIFYMAIPPSIFVAVGQGVRPTCMGNSGWCRVVVEKPFGKDSESSAKLGSDLAALFEEHQIYRIDHYLGKEMVQNLMVMRFANVVFEPLWNRHWISNVQITFKENFGTKGRGGYFDEFGIIRDVMQNHLLQILSLVAMDTPVTLSAEDVRNEKVKLLRAIQPIELKDVVLGQYGADPNGSEVSYLEDPTVPDDSVTPTFAAAVLHIHNERWSGVPFILKCGKALNERKAEIRIQFKSPANNLFTDTSNNELVLRVQPEEAVYMKMSTKSPGLEGGVTHTEMDLSYKNRFNLDEKKGGVNLPDAYERLIFDVIRGDHNLFVRSDELVAAWAIFTPLLHRIEGERIKPELYEYGSRGPASADELIQNAGYRRTRAYTWNQGGQN
jgi:glucose-6-phosphate 1-dehydrogenase